MEYKDLGSLDWNLYLLKNAIRQSEEMQCEKIDETIAKVNAMLNESFNEFLTLKVPNELDEEEPNDYEAILKKCPEGSKKLWDEVPDDFSKKLKGAMLGRFAGCTLGAPVEGWSATDIEAYAKELGLEFPLTDYWTATKHAGMKRYFVSDFVDYLKQNLTCVPNDDDVAFVILSMLIMKEGKGKNFTLEDVAKTWKKYVTLAYTAEDVALKNMEKGVPLEKVAEVNNPYQEWIGADIRCDGYAYAAAGNPRLAAKMAYTDAYLTHRKNGIYGSMYFAAVISAAFALGDPMEALKRGLLEIPENCRLANDIKWAFSKLDEVKTYKDAVKLVDERYPSMHIVHTLNNAILTVFAIHLGGNDIAKAFANAVAMAHDCDCTAATVGSIMGACYGIDNLDERWYKPFGDKVLCFYNGPKEYSIDSLLAFFENEARIGE